MNKTQAEIIWKHRALGYIGFTVSQLLYGLPTLYLGFRDNWNGPLAFYIWGLTFMLLGYYPLWIHRKAKKVLFK